MMANWKFTEGLLPVQTLKFVLRWLCNCSDFVLFCCVWLMGIFWTAVSAPDAWNVVILEDGWYFPSRTFHCSTAYHGRTFLRNSPAYVEHILPFSFTWHWLEFVPWNLNSRGAAIWESSLYIGTWHYVVQRGHEMVIQQNTLPPTESLTEFLI